MSDTKQVPHPGPTIVRRHHTKFSRPGNRRAVFVCPWCLLSELVTYMTSYLALPHCSLLDTKQVCGKFIAVQWKPAQTAHRSVWTVRLAVPFCQPFVITRHSSWLFTFAKYSCRDLCCTAMCSDCMCYVRRCGNPMAEMCFCCGSTGGGRARLKAVSWLLWLSVCSRRQLDTQKWENCTEVENKVFVRTVVLLGVFAKLRKATVSGAHDT